MPTSKGRKKPGQRRRGPTRRPARSAGSGIPPIDGLVKTVLRGGDELLEIEDPFEAELWASSVLGVFYKLPLPLDAREELQRTLGPALVEGAEQMADARGLAMLRALAAVGDADLVASAGEAAARLAGQGVAEPAWAAAELGRPDFVEAWALTDPYGDQIAYYATFRYPDNPPHIVMALYDQNIGGIIKDAFAAYPRPDAADPRRRAEEQPGAQVEDADPGQMAARVLAAIEMGDLYVDNDWTPDFKKTRALLRTRMRGLPVASLPHPPPPPDERAREALVAEFLAGPHAPAVTEAEAIVDHCLRARCDYGDGDPLRWSPIVVELFMLDYLPRKAILDAGEIRALPEVLAGWVRFALSRRGLEERWIAETEDAVRRHTPAFRQAVTDHSNFGPAKAILNALLAAGVDPMDKRAVDAWMEDFNSRPVEERDEFFGTFPFPDR